MNNNMKKRNTSRPTAARTMAIEERKQTNLLEQIVNYTKLSAEGMLSNISDETRIRIRREKPHTLNRSANLGVITTTSSVAGTAAYTFSLSNLANASDISNLFDQYRILQVTVSITAITAGATGSIYTAFDFDDISTPTGINSMLEYDTLQVSSSSIVTQRTFTPRVLSEVYNSAVNTAYSTIARPWLDSSYMAVPHYGLKVFIPITPGPTYNYQVVADFVLQGRSSS